jgi:hypothetical protein
LKTQGVSSQFKAWDKFTIPHADKFGYCSNSSVFKEREYAAIAHLLMAVSLDGISNK